MIKISSSDKIIRLVSNYRHFEPEAGCVFFAVTSEKELEDAYKIFIENKDIKEICFYHKDVDFLLNAFKSFFKVIEAAGGLVKNQKGEYLFILRNDKWDLPKGKIEKGESVKTAAVREVEEECGVKELEIVKELKTTFHTYTMNDKAVFKPTYWFEMSTADGSPLIPQTEEGITEVKWIAKKDLNQVRENTYDSILDIIKEL
ncbi:MAG: hypothetical protein K0S44_3030 [Bacteroidetes bacterium]|jgi:8-oxo-dGTP pyrophosphatase MutT (NUDIX family)|nr:hypothetical protein [Bacteroidota bacterium]